MGYRGRYKKQGYACSSDCFLGTPTIKVIGEETGTENWRVALSAIGPPQTIQLFAIGAENAVINWCARGFVTEVRRP